jgi:hypothetical protein
MTAASNEHLMIELTSVHKNGVTANKKQTSLLNTACPSHKRHSVYNDATDDSVVGSPELVPNRPRTSSDVQQPTLC